MLMFAITTLPVFHSTKFNYGFRAVQ